MCGDVRNDFVKENPNMEDRGAWSMTASKKIQDMSYSLNSLMGGYIGDYIGDYYRGY